MLKTGDGGRTWTRTALPRHVYPGGINALAFDGQARAGILGGNGGLVMTTADRGATWAEDQALEHVPAITMADAHAIALDPRGGGAHFATSKGLPGYAGAKGAGFVAEGRADAVTVMPDGLAWLAVDGVRLAGVDGRGALLANGPRSSR